MPTRSASGRVFHRDYTSIPGLTLIASSKIESAKNFEFGFAEYSSIVFV
jgi:hypothetical protein